MQQHSIKKFALLASLLAYASFMYWIISAANTRTENQLLSFSSGIPYGDKFGHFLVMGLLALLVNLLLNTRGQLIGKRHFLLGSLIVGGIVTTEEFSQIFIPSRTFCPLDLLADYAGIFTFGRLSVWISQRRGRYIVRLVQYLIIKLWSGGAKRLRLTSNGPQV